MRTEIRLLGQRINTAPRSTRRGLVSAFYVSFAIVLGLAWSTGGRSAASFWVLEFSMLLGPILGGYFSRSTSLLGGAGLVEPFDGGRVLKYPERSGRPYLSSLLHPEVDRDPGIRVDERSLRRRDSAHYAAFRTLGTVIFLMFMLQFNSEGLSGEPVFDGLSTKTVNHIELCLLQVGWLFVCTLPQAILLWTEPDMEE